MLHIIVQLLRFYRKIKKALFRGIYAEKGTVPKNGGMAAFYFLSGIISSQ